MIRKDYIIHEFSIGDIFIWEWKPQSELNVCIVKNTLGLKLGVSALYISIPRKNNLDYYDLFMDDLNSENLDVLHVIRHSEKMNLSNIKQKYPEYFI